MKITEMKVDYISHMGDDLSVVNAARVSFDKESDWEINSNAKFPGDDEIHVLADKDTKLIAYLAKHNHWSPFAHATISLRIKAPIFIARQLVKHQVGLAWNEVSRRYVDSEPAFWFPKVWRGKPVNAKQGSSGEWVPPYGGPDATTSHEVEVMNVVEACLGMYNHSIECGIAPEQARMVLPQNAMTEWIWTGSLYAFARICNLRLDSHAQSETQEVAKMISDIVQPLFPVSWGVLVNQN